MSGDLATPVRTFSHGCSGGQPRWSEGRSAPLTCLLGVVPAEDNFSGLFINVLFGPFEVIVQLFRENYQNLPLGLLGIALVMEPPGISGVQQFRVMSFLPVSQTMALPHGDLSVNQDFVGVMDNSVQNGLCNSAAFLKIRMQPLVPVSRLVLGAEDHILTNEIRGNANEREPGPCFQR